MALVNPPARSRATSPSRFTLRLFASLATAALLVAPTVSRGAAPPATPAEVVSALRARLDSLAAADAFSGAVLLARGDTVLFRQAYGFASRETRTPNTPETRFNLGSINKTFTQIAIAQLAAAGKLRVTDTIARYLTDYPVEKSGRITIQELLDHRAGTGRMFGDAFRAARTRLRSVGDYFAVVRDEPLLFEPGERQQYSNTGYVLLGAILEKVSGQGYYDYVREHVYAPAGMRATDSYAQDEHVQSLATGYTRPPDAPASTPLSPNTEFLPMRGGPAGGGYSNVDDLLRFANAYRSGRLGGSKGASLGIAGGAPGVNAALEIMGGWTIVVLANLDPPAAEALTRDVRGWLRGAGVVAGGVEVEMGGGPGGAGGQDVHVSGRDADPREGPRRTLLPAEPVVVPMARAGHLPVVDVRVNGKGPFRFAIDTGGQGSARLDSSLVARLGLPVVGEVKAGDPSGRNLRTLPLVRLDSLSIGGARFSGLVAGVRDYNETQREREPVDGILGFGLFSDCTFTLDYPGNELRIESASLPPANGVDVLAYRDPHGIPTVSLDVDGHVVDAHLDAGSMGAFTLPDAMIPGLALNGEPRVVGHARTLSNTFDLRAADLRGTIGLGGLRFEHPTVTFQPVMPDVNVGARVLAQLRVTFDERSRRVRIERPADGVRAAGKGR